jgi:hypothetical protein
LVGLGLAFSVGTTWAQAVTAAAVYGTVTGADSTTIEQATVSVTNTANGERWQTATQAGGRYTLEYLSLGGSYTVEVRVIGFGTDHPVASSSPSESASGGFPSRPVGCHPAGAHGVRRRGPTAQLWPHRTRTDHH